MIHILSQKKLLVIDCDGPMANPQYLVDHVCAHIHVPRVDVLKSKQFQICDALGIPNEEVDLGFDRCKATFSSDSCHPIWESVEAIETLSLFYEWVIGTARMSSGNNATQRWSSRVYCPSPLPPSVVYHAQGQGNLFGQLCHDEDKLELCTRINAFRIIEDNPHEIRYFVESGSPIEPICIAYPYNESVATDFPEVFRDDWPQIVQHLMCLRA